MTTLPVDLPPASPEELATSRTFDVLDPATGRLLRDAKLYEIGAGTSEIRRMLIGRELFEKTA